MRSSPVTWSPSLFDDDAARPAADRGLAGGPEPVHLDLGAGAWVEHAPGWLTGTAPLFDELAGGLAWREPEVLMYGQRVRQPRRSAWLRLGDTGDWEALPLAREVLPQVARRLGDRYGRRFVTVGCNLYRDERDSVAWHGDRVHRERVESVIAIVSLGCPRTFALRPAGGGTGRRFALGHGDLLVMGGSCQRTWQHAVPKVARPVGPRLSVTFRHDQP